jgi:hypothetical protein
MSQGKLEHHFIDVLAWIPAHGCESRKSGKLQTFAQPNLTN